MKLLFALLLFAGIGFGASLDDMTKKPVEDMKYVSLSESTSPGGRCMDGTMAGYYVREGINPHLFVINLAGGGGCQDEAKCSARNGTRDGSSDYDLPWKGGKNLLDARCGVNPGFCEATHVFVPYCTSDSHRGIREPSDDSSWYSDYYFDGHSNFKAIIRELIKGKGLKNNKNKKVLLTGDSAGGIGAYFNVDALQEMIPKATVKTAPNAGWFNPGALPEDLPSIYAPSDYTNFKAGTHGNGLFDLIKSGGDLEDIWKMKDNLPADCLEKYVTSTDDKWWACNSMHIAYRYIKAPIFAIQTQYDENHIFTGGGAPKPHKIVDPSEEIIFKEYVDMMGNATRMSLQQLLDDETEAKKAHPDGIFSTSCKAHGNSADLTLANGKSWMEIVTDWFFQRGNLEEYYRQVEECGTDQSGLVLPCNADSEECHFVVPDPMVATCRQEVEIAGCLKKIDEQKCLKCANQNKKQIVAGGCSPIKVAKQIIPGVCEVNYKVTPDDPEAKYVKKIKNNGKEKKSTCGKLMIMKKGKIKRDCCHEKYGIESAVKVCPVTCSSINCG